MARIRLADVARRAGVSVMTVSNVVNNHPHVRPAMRARVEAAIAELGYRPHAGARQLATGRTGTIAITVPQLSVPYFAELSRELAHQARQLGYRVMIEQTIFGPDHEWAALRQHEEGVVDGVVFHPVMLDTDRLTELMPNLPLVLLGEPRAPAALDQVMIDNVTAARQAVDHLIKIGRRRIAFLGKEQHDITQATRDRLQGWEEALRQAESEPVETAPLRIGGYRAADGDHAVTAALDDGLTFDGLLCRDDMLAIGAIRALYRAGRRVPEDVAVIGWDDVAFAPFVTPPLTTVSPDKAEIAHTALRLLQDRITGYDGAGIHRIANAELAIRESAPQTAWDDGVTS